MSKANSSLTEHYRQRPFINFTVTGGQVIIPILHTASGLLPQSIMNSEVFYMYHLCMNSPQERTVKVAKKNTELAALIRCGQPRQGKPGLAL
jgi:hypothetical protein